MNIFDAELTPKDVKLFGISIKTEKDLTVVLTSLYEKLLKENEEDIIRLNDLIKNRHNKRVSKKAKKARKNHFSYEEQIKNKTSQNDAIKKVLADKHFQINLGIRPEDVYLSKDITSKDASHPFHVDVTNIEMLGKNYLIHANNKEDKIVANINHKPSTKIGDKVQLCFDLEGCKLFDPITGVKIS